jgi:MFS family permease
LGIITFVGILISGFFLRRDPKDMGLLPDGEGVETVPEVKKLNPGFRAAGISMREALHMKQFWMIAGLFSCFGFCRSAFTAHLAAHIQDLGFSLTDGANVLAVVIGSSMFSRIGMGRVADIIGNRSAFMISFAATAASLLWGLFTKDLWGLYLFAFVFGFGWGNQAVLRFALTSEVFGLASLGLVMGVMGFAEQATAGFGSYFAGYIFDAAGDYRPVFWMGVGISIMGILLAWALKPLKGKR